MKTVDFILSAAAKSTLLLSGLTALLSTQLFFVKSIVGASPYETQRPHKVEHVANTAPALVRASGTGLIAPDGSPLYLRGVNLGGWLNWEGWMWGGGLVSEEKIKERLTKLVGEAEMEQFTRDIYQTFITEADVKRIKQLGFNSVRVPISYMALEQEVGWQALDRLVEWAESEKLYVILDFHAAPRPQSLLFTANGRLFKPTLWDRFDSGTREIALIWRAIAQRYRDRTYVAGYDLLNEPATGWQSDKKLVRFYETIISTIRDVDPHHMIILEGDEYSTDFSMIETPLDDNIAYQFHQYLWADGKKVNQHIEHYKSTAQRLHAPMFNGEFGVDRAASIAAQRKKYESAFTGFDGWFLWSWKTTPPMNKWQGIPPDQLKLGISLIQTPPQWQKVMDKISKKKSAQNLTRSEALQGMNAFIESIKLANTKEDQELLDALFQD